MNRIILIGNGFDLAHGLPTSYGNFMDWYWNEWKIKLVSSSVNTIQDNLCEFTLLGKGNTWLSFLYDKVSRIDPVTGKELVDFLKKVPGVKINPCNFLEEISKSIETKGWVDIENEYYKLLIRCSKGEILGLNHMTLNTQLNNLRYLLIEYLNNFSINNGSLELKQEIKSIIYSPINPNDVSVNQQQLLDDHINYWIHQNEKSWHDRFEQYEKCVFYNRNGIEDLKSKFCSTDYKCSIDSEYVNPYFLLPNNILFLNFNYTPTPYLYVQKNNPWFEVNHIHGELSNPESVVFGYGDELDENYKKLSDLNDNEYLKCFKSIKYLESDRYRKALQFMDAAPFQVCIMGHSCGNSDRTFLNTLFEHKNCVSIKPYYHLKKDGTDNYLDIVQNISRNFTDMKLMRDRVVNKTFCEPFSSK